MAKIITFENDRSIYVWKTVFHKAIDFLIEEFRDNEDWVGQLEAYRGMSCLFLDGGDSKISDLFPIILMLMLEKNIPHEISENQRDGYYPEIRRILGWFEERQKSSMGNSSPT